MHTPLTFECWPGCYLGIVSRNCQVSMQLFLYVLPSEFFAVRSIIQLYVFRAGMITWARTNISRCLSLIPRWDIYKNITNRTASMVRVHSADPTFRVMFSLGSTRAPSYWHGLVTVANCVFLVYCRARTHPKAAWYNPHRSYANRFAYTYPNEVLSQRYLYKQTTG